HAHWDRLKAQYGERFYRMWRYYLLSSAGAFRARKTQVWQILLFPLRAEVSSRFTRRAATNI
ncbi:MAG TPA: class I SAM-dependent methyltransferase, partial [Candidatus Acidoferrales bacterium]|nr:class I SAM-dependent methyltransferase [Candidatus Acidoferrales bacterium]